MPNYSHIYYICTSIKHREVLDTDHFESMRRFRLGEMIDKEKDEKIRQKLLVFWHMKGGMSERHIEKMLRIPRTTIGLWVRKFRKDGTNSFKRKAGSGGHNRYLTKEQEKELQEHLRANPSATKETLVFISNEYGKKYHPIYIYQLLKRLKQALITPRKRHYKANPRSGWAFKGHIKKD